MWLGSGAPSSGRRQVTAGRGLRLRAGRRARAAGELPVCVALGAPAAWLVPLERRRLRCARAALGAGAGRRAARRCVLFHVLHVRLPGQRPGGQLVGERLDGRRVHAANALGEAGGGVDGRRLQFAVGGAVLFGVEVHALPREQRDPIAKRAARAERVVAEQRALGHELLGQIGVGCGVCQRGAEARARRARSPTRA